MCATPVLTPIPTVVVSKKGEEKRKVYSKQRALVAVNIMQKNTKVFSNKNITDIRREVLVVIGLLNLGNVFYCVSLRLCLCVPLFYPLLFLARYPPFPPPL